MKLYHDRTGNRS